MSNLFGPYDARLLRRSFVQRNQQVTLRVGASTGLYPAWAAFLARHPGSWSKLTECPTETVYQAPLHGHTPSDAMRMAPGPIASWQRAVPCS